MPICIMKGASPLMKVLWMRRKSYPMSRLPYMMFPMERDLPLMLSKVREEAERYVLMGRRQEKLPKGILLSKCNYSGVRSQEPESRIEAVYASSNLPTNQKFEVP